MADEHLNAGLKTGRIEALSDGIFAVAMTILIYYTITGTLQRTPSDRATPGGG